MNEYIETSPISIHIAVLALTASLCGVLSACGFHLRDAVELPAGMNTIYTEGFNPASPFVSYLGQNLKHSDAKLTLDREEAGVVLKATNEQFLRREVSLSDTGKANMYELSYILNYDLLAPAGEVIQAGQSIKIIREYFNPQVQVIGKSAEEDVIRKEMYQEAVRNLLRRAEVALRNRSEPGMQ